RCLVIMKEDEQITWYPKNANDPNFRNELEKQDWKKYFEDLEQLIGISNRNEYLRENEKGEIIKNHEDLKAIWTDRYDDDKQCWLKLTVINANEIGKEDEKVPDEMPNMQSADSKNEQEEKRFNIKLMLELVKKAEEAEAQIKDKNVILFLGGTGAGKSTLIHFLSGSKMEQQTVNGIDHIAPVQIKNNSLSDVITKPGATSVTRYITAVPINLKEMDVIGDIGAVVLCDTPGFGDSSGPEVDVANGIGVIKALQSCKSVKPVVLISYIALGDRMEGVKDLARTLVGIMPSVEEHLNAFSYVFTKFPEDKKKKIHDLFKETYQSVTKDELDKGYKAVLKEIAKKTRKGVIAPDLLNDPPNELLEMFLEEKDFIPQPSSVFQPFLTTKSKFAVHLQVEKHKADILLVFKHRNYQSAKIKLDELCALNNVLKNDSIERDYNDCVKKLTQEWNEKIEQAKYAFNKCITSPHEINKEDVLAYETIMNELKSADQLRSHLKEAICADSLVQNLNGQIDDLLREIKNNINNPNELKIHLDKLMQIGNCFSQFATLYTQACQTLANHLMNYVNDAKEYINTNKFEEFRNNLEKIAKILPLQSNLISLFDIKTQITNLETLLLTHLNNEMNKGIAVIKKGMKKDSNSNKEDVSDPLLIPIEKLDKYDIEVLETSTASLETAMNVFELRCEHFNLSKPTTELLHALLNEIIIYFEKISQQAASLFEKKRYHAFDEIKEFVNVMDDLRKIKAVEQRTQRSYFQIIERIFGFVRDVHKDIDVMLPSLLKQDSSFDYNRLFDCIVCVDQSKWIDERQGGRSNKLMDDLKNKIIFYLHELQQSCQHLEFDIDHPDHLEQGRKIITYFEKLRKLESIIPEISNYRKEVAVQIEHAIRTNLSSIEYDFSLNTNNICDQKEIKEQLVKLKMYAEQINKANAYLEQKGLKSVQELDSRIKFAQEELTKCEIVFRQRIYEFDYEILTTDERITRLMKIDQNYQELDQRQSWITKSFSQKAISFLQDQGFKSIQDVKEQGNRERENLANLQEKSKSFRQIKEKEISKLKTQLEQYESIKKEYYQQQSKGEGPLEVVSDFLKNHGFSDNELTILINDENELIKKIKQYEQEIDRCKNNFGNNGVLNASRVEKVLTYLKECKSVVPSFMRTVITSFRPEDGQNEDKQSKKVNNTLKQEIAAMHHLVENYLRHYAEFVQSQLRFLAFTETASSESEKMKLREKVEAIGNRVNEVMKLEKQNPIIFSYFPQDIVRQFTIKAEQIWLNLSDEMLKLSKHGNLSALKAKIFVTKTLSTLDEYTKSDCKFRVLYLKYQEILLSDTIDTTKVREAIGGHRYTEVAAEMFTLNQRGDESNHAERALTDAKVMLSHSLKVLSKNTKTKVVMLRDNEVDLDQIAKIEEQLRWIDDAKTFVFDYLDTNTQHKIDKMQRNIKLEIEKWLLKILANARTALDYYHFWETEEKIKLIKKTLSILGDHCEHISLDDSKEEKVKEETNKIIDTINELEKQLECTLKRVVNEYKNINLSECQFNPYAFNPPKDIYAKLNKAMQATATHNYKEAWDEIQQDITKKIRDQLLETHQKVHSLNARDIDIRIRLCESVLNSLPEHMQPILKAEILHCREDINYEREHMTES
ncbi:Helicase conserved domain containing protein, partial [Reticulomyxa filosa]